MPWQRSKLSAILIGCRLGARLNRKERRGCRAAFEYATDPGLEIVNRDAAGILMWETKATNVTVPRGPGRANPCASSALWTAALVEMAQWLMRCGIRAR